MKKQASLAKPQPNKNINLKNFQGAIFDLDGTLLYTIEDLADSLNEVLAQEGLPAHDYDSYSQMMGDGLEMFLIKALPKALRIPAHVRPLLKKFLETYCSRQTHKTRPYPGIENALNSLLENGIRLAVLSNKAQQNTQNIVEHFFPQRFELILGLRAGISAKPDPVGAFEIAEKFNINPENFLFFGDSEADIKTALAANMFPVAVSWGYRNKDKLLAAGAKIVIDHPFEINTRWGNS